MNNLVGEINLSDTLQSIQNNETTNGVPI